MDKLATFQQNDPVRLLRLAKKLQEDNFFRMFLNDVQLKILNHVISQNNEEVWNNFINGNSHLKYAQDIENQPEELIESGPKAIKMLALHVRYLLWEKAIDFYYDSKSLEESSERIVEQSDSGDLIEEISKEPVESTAESGPTVKEVKTTVRDEEDDYDDDDDEGDEDQSSQPEIENNDSEKRQGNVEYNDKNLMVLEIPVSIFEEESTQEPETTNMSNSEIDPTNSSRTQEEQENLIREFNKVYHNFEYDRETLIKRRKLEHSDMQLEQSGSKLESSEEDKNNMEINLGAASTSLQHLISTIQENRDSIPLNDFELRNLFMDVRKNRGKWASDERVGQEELYEACEKVVHELRGYTEHSTPFLNKVSKREAPNYGLIIKTPMDLNTTMKKLKNLNYNSKREFVDDLMLIWSNCLTYNADPKHFLRAHAIAMQKKTLKLIPSIPDITIRSRAEVEKEEEALESETKSGTPVAGKSSKKGRKRTRENKLKNEDETKDSSEDILDSDSLQATPAAEGSFNNNNDSNNNQENEVEAKKSAENNYSAGVEMDDDEYDEEEKLGSSSNNVDEEEDEIHPEIQAWKTLTAKSRANYCAQRAQLFNQDNSLRLDAPAIIRKSRGMTNFNTYLNNKEVVSKSNNLLENDEPYLLEYDITGGLPRLRYTGITEEDQERREQKLVDKILENNDYGTSKFASSTDSGLNKMYIENITEIQEIRKICFKISLIRQMQTQQFVHHTQMKQQEIDEIKEVDIDVISKLENHDPFNDKVQYSVLRKNIAKIAMQTGFESTESFAINTLTQVAERYVSNLTKSIKLHSETASSNKLSSREVILLSLLENGIDKPDDLYTFVQEKIVKQQEKLKDLRSKLANFLKELLRPGLENFNERSFTDNSEQFITGDFSNGLGDDFFGFKELGLDKEFNLLSSSIPVYLLHSRLHNSFTSTSSVSKLQKYKDLTDYVPATLKASDIDSQIGLLKPFYQKLHEKSKAHFIKNQKKKGESTELPHNNQLLLIEDEELPQKQRNTRPRLPPTGKISAIKKKVVANSFFIVDDDVVKTES